MTDNRQGAIISVKDRNCHPQAGHQEIKQSRPVSRRGTLKAQQTDQGRAWGQGPGAGCSTTEVKHRNGTMAELWPGPEMQGQEPSWQPAAMGNTKQKGPKHVWGVWGHQKGAGTSRQSCQVPDPYLINEQATSR